MSKKIFNPDFGSPLDDHISTGYPTLDSVLDGGIQLKVLKGRSGLKQLTRHEWDMLSDIKTLLEIMDENQMMDGRIEAIKDRMTEQYKIEGDSTGDTGIIMQPMQLDKVLNNPSCTMTIDCVHSNMGHCMAPTVCTVANHNLHAKKAHPDPKCPHIGTSLLPNCGNRLAGRCLNGVVCVLDTEASISEDTLKSFGLKITEPATPLPVDPKIKRYVTHVIKDGQVKKIVVCNMKCKESISGYCNRALISGCLDGTPFI
jgi:hypothetical protein